MMYLVKLCHLFDKNLLMMFYLIQRGKKVHTMTYIILHDLAPSYSSDLMS